MALPASAPPAAPAIVARPWFLPSKTSCATTPPTTPPATAPTPEPSPFTSTAATSTTTPQAGQCGFACAVVVGAEATCIFAGCCAGLAAPEAWGAGALAGA